MPYSEIVAVDHFVRLAGAILCDDSV